MKKQLIIPEGITVPELITIFEYVINELTNRTAYYASYGFGICMIVRGDCVIREWIKNRFCDFISYNRPCAGKFYNKEYRNTGYFWPQMYRDNSTIQTRLSWCQYILSELNKIK